MATCCAIKCFLWTLFYGLDCCHSSVADNDYKVSFKNVTIPAYAREIKIPVEALRDTDYNGTEFIKATLKFIQQPPVKVNILSATAYIAIVDATGKAAAKYCVYSYVIYLQCMSQETLRNPTNSVENVHEFRKASVQLSVELQYYFHGECLPFSRNDTSLSYVRYTTVVKIEALTCSLPVLLLSRS